MRLSTESLLCRLIAINRQSFGHACRTQRMAAYHPVRSAFAMNRRVGSGATAGAATDGAERLLWVDCGPSFIVWKSTAVGAGRVKTRLQCVIDLRKIQMPWKG